ncbi:MAG: neutral/alkaline non-lysosomal ceramidase N-terminal domain-containing protein [Treponema sp.]|jgi:hypothetical protein|nr:neutral/alkaline non-lysosomal ceramidase N-terminal domain-containing protein [Treponema sp.]
MMRAGFSRRDITPPDTLVASGGVPLAGYGVTRAAAGVHDRLYARALALSPVKGRASGVVVLLVLDALYLDGLCMDAIYRGVAAFGLTPDQLLVNCIHTHSSFGGIFDASKGVNRAMTALLGAATPALVDLLVSESLAAIKEAIGNAENAPEASLRAARGELEGLGSNRHDPKIESDGRILALELICGGRKILLYNLSCHPTVMNADNLFLSADFPGAAAAELERDFDGVIFINGAAGDMSTRFTRRESYFTECARYGKIMAERAGALLQNAPERTLETASLDYHTLSLRAAAVPGEKTACAGLDGALQNLEALKAENAGAQKIRVAESLVEGARMNLLRARYGGDEAELVNVRTGIVRINDITALCVPFELFSTLALPLIRKTNCAVFGYANEYQGYLADSAAHDNGDYEALSSRFARGEGEKYITALRNCFPAKTP